MVLVVLACVLRALTKIRNFFQEKVNPLETMNLPTPGKILRATMFVTYVLWIVHVGLLWKIKFSASFVTELTFCSIICSA